MIFMLSCCHRPTIPGSYFPYEHLFHENIIFPAQHITIHGHPLAV